MQRLRALGADRLPQRQHADVIAQLVAERMQNLSSAAELTKLTTVSACSAGPRPAETSSPCRITAATPPRIQTAAIAGRTLQRERVRARFNVGIGSQSTRLM